MLKRMFLYISVKIISIFLWFKHLKRDIDLSIHQKVTGCVELENLVSIYCEIRLALMSVIIRGGKTMLLLGFDFILKNHGFHVSVFTKIVCHLMSSTISKYPVNKFCNPRNDWS